MKKIKLSLLCLFLASMAGFAQSYKIGTRATTLETGKKYMIYNTCLVNGVTDWTAFLYESGDHVLSAQHKPADFATIIPDNSYIWEVTVVDAANGIYNLRSNSGKYANVDTKLVSEVSQLYIKPWAKISPNNKPGGDVHSESEAGSSISGDAMTADATLWTIFDGNENTSKNWTSGGPAQFKLHTSGQPFAFYNVTEVTETLEKITHIYNFSGTALDASVTVTKTMTNTVVQNEPLEISEGDYVTKTSGEPVVSGTTATVTHTVTVNFPFKLAGVDESGNIQTNKAVPYTLLVRGDQCVYATGATPVAKCEGILKFGRGSVWCFLPAQDDCSKVHLYNMLTEKYVKVADANQADAEFVDRGEATAFEVFQGTSNGTTHPALKIAGTWHFLGDHKNGGSQALSVWTGGEGNKNDGGHHYAITQVGDDFFNLLSSEPMIVGNDYVQVNTSATGITDAKSTYTTTKNLDNLEAYFTAVEENEEVILTFGNYYRLVSNKVPTDVLSSSISYADQNGTFQANGGGRNISIVSEDDKDYGTLWTPIRTDSYFYLKNANANLAIGQNGGDMPLSFDWAAKCKYEAGSELGTAKFRLETTEKYLNNTDAGINSGQAAENYLWKIEKVTEIPVAIGTAGWASLVLPFAVELPAGVKAYYAETGVSGDVFTLTEWTEDVVPAYMPVFVTGTPGNVNFALSTTTTANPGNNVLKGYTMMRKNFTGDNNSVDNTKSFAGIYALKANTDKLGLLTETVKTFPANRVYVEAAANGAKEVRLGFDETTGIEESVAEQQNSKDEVYYDLNGRRVWNPKKGIFTTASGKKVFINK